MLQSPGAPGQASDVSVTGVAVARMTCTAWSPVKGWASLPAAYCARPQDISRPNSPPRADVEAEVLPCPATENMLCGPQLVSLARIHLVPLVSAMTPLPGTTSGQYMPPWWSVESKSLLDSTITTPRLWMASIVCRMKDEKPRSAVTEVMTLAPAWAE